jgi:hypothetical protein
LLWLYKKPTQVTPRWNLLAPVRQLSSNSLKCKGVFFTSATSVHCRTLPGISFLTCQSELGIHYPILLCQTNRQYLIWWTVSSHCRNSSLGCVKHEEKSDCMHCWMQWTFATFSDFNVIYFLTNRTCVRNGLCDFLITLYKDVNKRVG